MNLSAQCNDCLLRCSFCPVYSFLDSMEDHDDQEQADDFRDVFLDNLGQCKMRIEMDRAKPGDSESSFYRIPKHRIMPAMREWAEKKNIIL
jgi:hypothetical protein